MKIRIEYCGIWNYEPKASSLEEEIKNVYSDAQIICERSDGGVFEIELNGELIFSKFKLSRFPDDGEILEKIKSKL